MRHKEPGAALERVGEVMVDRGSDEARDSARVAHRPPRRVRQVLTRPSQPKVDPGDDALDEAPTLRLGERVRGHVEIRGAKEPIARGGGADGFAGRRVLHARSV